MEVNGQLHAPAALAPGKAPVTQSTGGWVGPRAGLDAMKRKTPKVFDNFLAAKAKQGIITATRHSQVKAEVGYQ